MNSGVSQDEFETWCMVTRSILERAFGSESQVVSDVIDAGGPIVRTYNTTDLNLSQSRWEKLKLKGGRLNGAIQILRSQDGSVEQVDSAGTSRVAAGNHSGGNRIFLVHGHDQARLQEVARFLEKLSLEVVILRDEPNKGRAIIQKFKDHSDVRFAIVLLTADDLGKAKADLELAPRARQNVLFELGFFIGFIGSENVCALYETGVEIPSDYAGVAFTSLSGHWQAGLIKELRAAGFEIDSNKVF